MFSLINPISHGSTPTDISKYRIEPYVVAADVYGIVPHVGRGGWSWYTGSAGWMYRLIVESLIGLNLESNKLRINPCLPAEWGKVQVHYRYRETFYHITIQQDETGALAGRLTLDGADLPDDYITLVDDGRDHEVEFVMPANQIAPQPIHSGGNGDDRLSLGRSPQQRSDAVQ